MKAGSKQAVLLLAAVCLLGLFSGEAVDSDFWWHLRTGQAKYSWERTAREVVAIYGEAARRR